MCRWVAYTGSPVMIEDVLFKPKQSLIDQSMASKSAETPTSDAPTLYNSRDIADVYRMNPALQAGLSPATRKIVSEPVGVVAQAWVALPQATAMTVQGEQVVMQPFGPL